MNCWNVFGTCRKEKNVKVTVEQSLSDRRTKACIIVAVGMEG
jgi:hypothetical protein